MRTGMRHGALVDKVSAHRSGEGRLRVVAAGQLRRTCLVVSCLALLASMLAVAPSPAHAQEPEARILVFSKTTNFYHESIPHGIAAIEQLGAENDWEVVIAGDPTDPQNIDGAEWFNDEDLATFDAVVWNNTNSIPGSGDLLDTEQREAFVRYIQNGGGFAGIHAATAAERDWEWYEGLVGTIFTNHPPGQLPDGTIPGRAKVTDRYHPSTAELPELWEYPEEWYNWGGGLIGNVHVVSWIDTKVGITGLQEGPNHPFSWCHNYDGGRSWYTAGGHAPVAFTDNQEFLAHIEGGIAWAAGVAEGDCDATVHDAFEKVELADGNAVSDAMQIEVLPDGRVIFVQRGGQVRIIDQDTLEIVEAADLDTYTTDSDGLLGFALDPDHEDNGWVYLLYSDPDVAQLNVSRFTLVDDELDLDSELNLLEIPTYRGLARAGVHMGGTLRFGPDGELYIPLGDNIDPFESHNYTPIDERPGREHFDAQSTSGDTSDLRGKVLRIVPTEDGYDIPDGNLFPPGEFDAEVARPEIYAMGMRNPFRIQVDPQTGTLLIADHGPDAPNDDPERGPKATVEYTPIYEAGNYGWPYCTGPNNAYVDYDFETGESGEPFDCENGPTNDSPNNGGLEQLPPAEPALIWYGYDLSEEFPELGAGGAAPAAGPVYRYDADLDSETKFPEFFDGKWFIYEWERRWFKLVSLHEDEHESDEYPGAEPGDVLSIDPIFGDMTFLRPMDATFGPDGSLYVIEWGSNFGGDLRGDPNSDDGIYRIDYVPTNPDAPRVNVTADPDVGEVPLDVTFTGTATSPVDADLVSFAWDLGDGTEASGTEVEHTYTEPGSYTATLTVTDENGLQGSDSVTVVAQTDLDCPDDPVTVATSFDDGTTQGWGAAGNTGQVVASDVVARSGAFSLLIGSRPAFSDGATLNVTAGVEPGSSYVVQAWLRVADGQGPAELQITGITTIGGARQFSGLDSIEADDDDWYLLEVEIEVADDAQAYELKLEGAAGVDFHVDDFLVIDPEVAGGELDRDDHFDGDELDRCRWDRIVRENADDYWVEDGRLWVNTTPGGNFGANNQPPVENQFLQTIHPDEDWLIETKVDAPLEQSFQQAGLLYYQDDANYVKLDVVADNALGSPLSLRVELRSEIDDQPQAQQGDIEPAPDNPDDEWWLRLAKEGDTFTGWVSVDGETWIEVDDTVQNDAIVDGGYGLVQQGRTQTAPVTVGFDYFVVDPDDDGPTDPGVVVASLDPADPDGDNDWYVSPVSLILSSDDEDAELAWREAGDTDWIEWTAPVTFDVDGQYTIEHLGTDDDDEPSDVAEVDVGPGFTFSPNQVSVSQGDEVVFTLQGGFHNVVIEDLDGNEIDRSGAASSDWDTYEFTADAPGTFIFHCEPHPGMEGTLVVAEGDGGEPGVGSVAFQIDQTPPETSAALDGEMQGDAYVGEVTLTLEATDAMSGPDEIEWYVAGNDVIYVDDADEPVVVTFDTIGSHTVGFFAVDYAGNVEEAQSIDVEIVEDDDGPTEPPAPPSIVLEPSEPDGPDGAYISPVTVTVSAEPGATIEWREAGDDHWSAYEGPVTFSEVGSYDIEARATNDAGTSDTTSASFTIVEDDDPPPPPPTEVCARHQGGASFPDVPGSGHGPFIDCLAELGIVQGFADGTYRPAEEVSRGQLATYVVHAIEVATGEALEAGGALFPDVGVNSTHGQAITKLRNAGIIRGFEDGTFRPAQSVSRDQTARYVVNALELVLDEPLATSGVRFPDVTASQYVADIDKLATAGVIGGFTDGTFGPRLAVTRGQMARFVANSLEVLAAEGAYHGP